LAALIEQATLRVVFSPLFDAAHALALSDRALDLARTLGDRMAESKIRWNQMRALVGLGADARQAIAYGEQSLALAREVDAPEQMAYTLNDLQYAYRADGQWAHALAVLAEARALWQARHNPHMLADNLIQTAGIHLYRGEYDTARTLFADAERLNQISNNVTQLGLSRFLLAQLYLDLGQPAQTLRCLDEGWQFVAAFNPGPLLALRATTYTQYGAHLPALQMAYGLYTAIKSTALVKLVGPGIMAVLARTQIRWGDVRAAEAVLAEARAHLKPGDELRNFQNGEEVAWAEIELALTQRHGQRALHLVEAFLNTITAFGARRLLPETLYLKGKALHLLGRLAEAEATFHEAQAEAEALGHRRILWLIRRAQPAPTADLARALAEHCSTNPLWLPDEIRHASPTPLPTLSLRAAFLHQAFDREAITAQYHAMRADFQRLLDAVADSDWPRRGATLGWTVGELLVHLALSLEQVPLAATFLRRGRAYFPVPPAVFDWGNLVYAKTLARFSNRAAIAQRYDAAHAAALTTLNNLSEAEWQMGAICFGDRYWTVERLFANQPLHLAEHTAHIYTIVQTAQVANRR
jgi:tetratricopeptide (TPR) repeat protein